MLVDPLDTYTGSKFPSNSFSCCFLLRRFHNTTARAARIASAPIPPTTPPAIAPVFVLLEGESVGSTGREIPVSEGGRKCVDVRVEVNISPSDVIVITSTAMLVTPSERREVLLDSDEDSSSELGPGLSVVVEASEGVDEGDGGGGVVVDSSPGLPEGCGSGSGSGDGGFEGLGSGFGGGSCGSGSCGSGSCGSGFGGGSCGSGSGFGGGSGSSGGEDGRGSGASSSAADGPGASSSSS